MRTSRRRALTAALAATLSLAVATAHGHGLGVWAEPVDADRIRVEATWSTASPAAGAHVAVLAADGTELLTGSTGEDGRFHFDAPADSAWPLEIRVDGGDDHRGRFVLEADGAVPARGEHGHGHRDH
jgi:hypothetical protein